MCCCDWPNLILTLLVQGVMALHRQPLAPSCQPGSADRPLWGCRLHGLGVASVGHTGPAQGLLTPHPGPLGLSMEWREHPSSPGRWSLQSCSVYLSSGQKMGGVVSCVTAAGDLAGPLVAHGVPKVYPAQDSRLAWPSGWVEVLPHQFCGTLDTQLLYHRQARPPGPAPALPWALALRKWGETPEGCPQPCARSYSVLATASPHHQG